MTGNGPAGGHDLRAPGTPQEWSEYHSIRRRVLWESRGRVGLYDENHPDEHSPGHHPMLLWYDEAPVGVVRIDFEDDRAILRRVAIREDMQRKGHGRRLLQLAERFAREHGRPRLYSFVAPDAAPFYEKCGFRRDARAPESPEHVPPEHVPMEKLPGPGDDELSVPAPPM
jgi:GNAT superfamily N-acetyltransferase